MPASWRATNDARGVVARAHPAKLPLVSVTSFRLLRPYRPALFAKTARELDRVAAKLVRDAHGTLTRSETTTVAGRRVRAYSFTARPSGGAASRNRIGFVLVGRTEYQLLCQAPAGESDPDGACALLFSSFHVDTSS